MTHPLTNFCQVNTTKHSVYNSGRYKPNQYPVHVHGKPVVIAETAVWAVHYNDNRNLPHLIQVIQGQGNGEHMSFFYCQLLISLQALLL